MTLAGVRCGFRNLRATAVSLAYSDRRTEHDQPGSVSATFPLPGGTMTWKLSVKVA